jgi:hypothetical protein
MSEYSMEVVPSPDAGVFVTSEEFHNNEEKEMTPITIVRVLPLKADTNTSIIFDWDDTLMASSHLSKKGYHLAPGNQRDAEVDKQLMALERTVSHLLSVAMQMGNVFIITNAQHGWVQMSAQKFMPTLFPWLAHIPVLSARSTFEKKFPNQPLLWKVNAFEERLRHLHDEEDKRNKHVLSFGDMLIDRQAAITVVKGIHKIPLKNVKLAEQPSIMQLQQQLELILKFLPQMYQQDGDMDLMLTIQQLPNK